MSSENRWPVPAVGDAVPLSALALEHPTYTEKKQEWEFFRHSDELTGGYRASTATFSGTTDVSDFDITYLIPHEKEMDRDAFKRRVAAAKPPRFVREGIEHLVGVVTNEEPNRDTYPEAVRQWTNAVDPDGRTLQEWISTQMWPLVERYGHCYSLTKRPDVAAENLQEQEKKITRMAVPGVMLTIINPENLPWWNEDEHGNLEIVRFVESKTCIDQEGSFATQATEYKRHWWITRAGWWYCDENNPEHQETVVLGAGFFNRDGAPLKYFPVVKWGLKNGSGPTSVAAFAQLMYFRKDSELHSIEVNAAFPMTWLPLAAGDEDIEETVRGHHVVGGYDAESGGKPIILETSGVSLDHFIEKRLPALEEEALSPYGRQREVGGNDSGVALAHIQQNAINIYRQHAMYGSQSEFMAIRTVAEMLGSALPDDTKVAWAKKFGALSDSSQGELLTAFWDLDPGDEFKKHILSQFAQVALADLTAEQLSGAIDAWHAEKSERDQREAEERKMFLSVDDGDAGDEQRREISRPAAANPRQVQGGPQKER